MKVRIEKDSIDLEDLKDCVRMPGYAHIADKHGAMLEAFRTSLEKEADPSQVRFIQGQIDALRSCMSLPQIIADEIRMRQRKSKTAD